jgi:hypothetical protein
VARRSHPVPKQPAPGRERPRLVAAAAQVASPAATNELRLPAGVLMLLAAGALFLLVIVAVAAIPARALPSKVAERVDGRREQLLFVGLCTLAAGFALTFLLAFAAS